MQQSQHPKEENVVVTTLESAECRAMEVFDSC